MSKPRIAIPEIDQDVRNYTRAVTASGMEPIVISKEHQQVRCGYQQEYLDYSQFRADAYDGLLIPGGWDIDPRRYGQSDHGECILIMEEMDDLQLAILDDFIRRGKPVLGICRGLQLINVYFGGTLIQHLPTSFRHFRPLDTPVDKRHGCHAQPGSWLEKLYGREFIHNSSHHQAVDRLAPELVIDSVCLEDGVVEALHHETLPVYGVQWHPERMCLRFASQDMVNGLHVLRFFSGLCGGDPRPHDELEKSGIMEEGMGV